MAETATQVETVTAPAGEAGAAKGPTRWLSLGVRVLVIAAIAAGMTWSVVSQWPDVRQTWLDLAWPSVVLAVLAVLAGMFANSMAWRAAATDLEHRVSVPAALRICMVGQLGKYIPGSVWAYVLQMELARRAGLPRARAFLATLVALGLGVVAALGVGLLSLPSLLDATAETGAEYAESVRVALYIVAVLFPIALVCAIPAVLTRLIQLVLKVLRRPPLQHRLTLSGVLRVVGWSALGYTLFGVHLWLLANAQAAPGLGGLLRSIGSFAIAMTVGMFAFLSPSGLGVREAVLVATMAPFLADAGGLGAATGIALASRLIFTVADLLAAGIAALSGVRQLRRSGGTPAADATPAAPVAAEQVPAPRSATEPSPAAATTR
ncbi:lysylphosphatidylglycerol synthase transmembrane domain-containing protein [Micromonospora sp. CPCC 205561]|uniref:lysylphosphatidylglycerol synthase transmembrane domain-containing protein n=1 Tax=Micromonospora sp. CPCC 205561 TaxID=3122407 RepID=UPI002FF1586A